MKTSPSHRLRGTLVTGTGEFVPEDSSFSQQEAILDVHSVPELSPFGSRCHIAINVTSSGDSTNRERTMAVRRRSAALSSSSGRLAEPDEHGHVDVAVVRRTREHSPEEAPRASVGGGSDE